MTKKKPVVPVNVIQKEGQEPIAIEIVENAIVDLARGMKSLSASRLKHDAIITLLHRASGVSRSDIEKILGVLDRLEEIFLKSK